MTTQKNVGRVRPEAVTHQDQPTGQNEWQVLPIEQIADVNPRIDKSSIPDDIPVSFVPMPAVGAGDGSIRVNETRPAREVKKGFTGFLEGDVLFAKITPCMENGKMAVVPKLVNGYGFGSTEFHVLRPKPGMEAKYLYYFVSSQSFRGEAERYMTGAVGQKRVSTTYLKESKIPVAPLDQQIHIVAEIEKQFSRLDEAIANLKRVKANLKRYKAAVLKAAVEGRLVETEAELARHEGRSYETGAQLLQRILETRRSQWKGKGKYKEPAAPDTADFPELPKEWAVASLEQLTSGDRVICYGILMPKENVPNGILYVKVKDLKGDKVDIASLHRTTPEIAAKYARASLRTGDLLLAIRGTYGRVAEVPPELDGGNITQDTARLVVSPLMDSAFIAWFLRSQDAQNYFKRVARGVAVKGVNIADVRLCPVPLPTLREQQRIAVEVDRRLSLVREVEAQADANLKRAERLRRSILSRAFSGQLLREEARAQRHIERAAS
jgi:type I restriction enzyme, S subunit